MQMLGDELGLTGSICQGSKFQPYGHHDCDCVSGVRLLRKTTSNRQCVEILPPLSAIYVSSVVRVSSCSCTQLPPERS